MFQLLVALLLSFSAFAQEVVEVWPKGQVPFETAHVKVLFNHDKVKFEEVGSASKLTPQVASAKVSNCVWATRRIAKCDLSGLVADTDYTLKLGNYESKFRTMGVALIEYQEALDQNKFRLKLKFSTDVALKGLKIAVQCGSKAPQAFVGDLSHDGRFSLPVVAPENEVCTFSFPEGVKLVNGKSSRVYGAWLLRGRLAQAKLDQNEQYRLAARGINCGRQSFWNASNAWEKGESMQVITCAAGDDMGLNIGDSTTNTKVSVSAGGPEFKFDQWGGSRAKIPEQAPASFTIIAQVPGKPQITVGYVVLVKPAALVYPGYAELADDGSYFEATKPYLTQLNHRSFPLVEVAAERLTDESDIVKAVTKGASYWERREVRERMPDGKTFQISSEGSAGFNSGLDLDKLDNFGPGIWWVQSTVASNELSNPAVEPEGDQKTRSSAAVLQFTDLGLHVKRGLKGGVVWVFRVSTGKALEGAEVSVSQGTNSVSIGKTNRDGIVRIPEDKQVDPAGVVIARKGEEFVALPLNYLTQSGISNWDYGLSMVSEDQLEWQYDAIPSNPLYRPAEKVALKFYARKSGLQGPVIADHNTTWAVTDPRGEKIASGNVVFNRYGTAMVDFSLTADAVTGKYQLTLGSQVLEPFSVEVFTPPTLKVVMDPLARGHAPVTATGTVEFHVGGGVKDTNGEAALIVRSSTFAPPSGSTFETFTFAQEAGSGAELVGKESFKTDKEGRFSATFNSLTLPEFGTLIAEATVADGDGMNVSGRTEIPVARRGWFPGTKLDGYVFKSGDEVRPEIIVLNAQGKPVSGVKAHYKLVRRTWNTVRRLGSGNAYYYDSVMREEMAGKCDVVTKETPVSCPLKASEEGSYNVVISTSYQGQSGPERTEWFWVPGPNSWGWGPRNNHDRIDVKPEKARYEYGDKARFLIQSPYKEGQALVTVERYGVIHHELVNFQGGLWTYELPLDKEAYVPGVYISVVLLKGRTGEKYEGGVDLGRPSFKMGYTEIQVARTPMELKVAASTAARFSPGETVEVALDVRDWRGKTVDGELAVTVVDDAVLQLVPSYKSFFEVMDTFYHVKGLGVWNYQTLTRLIGRRSFGKKGAVAGGGGGNGADALRSNFKTVAHWDPQLEIKDGKAKIKFKLPDNLTNWRVIAVAVDDKSRFGQGETTFRAVRPVMLTPFFPPFLRAGDAFTAAFGVQNATEEKIEAELTAVVKGLDPAKVEMEKEVAPGVRELLNASFKTTESKQVEVTAHVKAGANKDGVRIQFPILPEEGIRQVSGELVPLTGVQALNFSIPSTALKDSGRVKVYFSKSLLDGLDEAYRYVVHYPYGCWEQQTTGALFLTEYKEMQPWLAEFKFEEKEGDPRVVIQNYINKAPSYQRADGSMGYYPGDYAGDPYLTVFTGHAFAVYKKAGFTVPTEVESKLRARLLAMKDSTNDYGRFSKFQESLNAFIASILVDLGDSEGQKLAARLYSKRNKMDLFGKGMLLKALPVGKPEAKTVMDELLKASRSSGNAVDFIEKMEPEAKNWLYSARRGQCVVVDAILRQGVNPALAAKMIQGLAPDKKTARWGNTQENYFCFQTFRTYARAFESTDKAAEVAWTANGDSKTIDVKRLERPAVEYQTNQPVVAKAELKSGGNAYLHTRVFWSVKASEAVATGNGFVFTKQVYLKKGSNWLELKGREWQMKKGDTVKIVLNVKGDKDRFKVGVTDPLPAGWRALNPRLATTSAAALVEAGTEEEPKPERDWWDWDIEHGFISTDMRASSVQFFADSLQGGNNYTLEYLAQATTVGEFTLPAASVEEMYDEEVRASTTGVKVRVVE